MWTIIIIIYTVSIIFIFGFIVAAEKNWIHVHTWENQEEQICSSNYCPDRDKVREN